MGSEHASVVLAVLGWWFTALSTLLVVVCVLASRGSIHVNRYFGLKLPALLQSDSAWRKGHAAAIVPSAAMAAVGLTCAIIGIRGQSARSSSASRGRPRRALRAPSPGDRADRIGLTAHSAGAPIMHIMSE
ncbi:hypothetical protein MUN74_18760 [Agromyces endophyticus]|uniref:hypothetical protein n=1 Tax=Agromyces sp. H17E-10 TaxID=2932244 RepID=UPI001FD0780E|nr:hypothetical protein [Agromyces sp. H17E-10]UOQ89269.1 hypothetical protein MUN74_18760 [Agromyces sp. H17E-10]